MTRRDIELFTEISGDRNPLHYDEATSPPAAGSAASSSRAASCTAVLNAVVAEDLPGPGSVFLQLDLRFLAPCAPATSSPAP